jgi:hypothetical protein
MASAWSPPNPVVKLAERDDRAPNATLGLERHLVIRAMNRRLENSDLNEWRTAASLS